MKFRKIATAAVDLNGTGQKTRRHTWEASAVSENTGTLTRTEEVGMDRGDGFDNNSET